MAEPSVEARPNEIRPVESDCTKAHNRCCVRVRGSRATRHEMLQTNKNKLSRIKTGINIYRVAHECRADDNVDTVCKILYDLCGWVDGGVGLCDMRSID